jgi:hypothetical protein
VAFFCIYLAGAYLSNCIINDEKRITPGLLAGYKMSSDDIIENIKARVESTLDAG